MRGIEQHLKFGILEILFENEMGTVLRHYKTLFVGLMKRG